MHPLHRSEILGHVNRVAITFCTCGILNSSTKDWVDEYPDVGFTARVVKRYRVEQSGRANEWAVCDERKWIHSR